MPTITLLSIGMKPVNIILTVVIIVLSYLIFREINETIKFNKEKKLINYNQFSSFIEYIKQVIVAWKIPGIKAYPLVGNLNLFNLDTSKK